MGDLVEGADVDIVINFNQKGNLLGADFQLVKSEIAKVLKSNMVFQAINRAAFVYER